jgi:hypothetical protein
MLRFLSMHPARAAKPAPGVGSPRFCAARDLRSSRKLGPERAELPQG